MFTLVFCMAIILAIGALVLTYVAFPFRGYDVPRAEWLGDAMKRGVAQLPVLDDETDRERAHTR